MRIRAVMSRSLFVGVLSALPGIVLSSLPASAQTTHYVDNLGDCSALVPCHATIMDAVDAAAPADIIEVFPGVYHEGVVFGDGKNDIVLKAHIDALMPVIAAPAGSGVVLRASGVQVRGFVIEPASGAGGVSGDGLPGSAGAVIQDNLIRGSSGGISFRPCSSSTITNNRILGGGIALNLWSGGCSVEGNMLDGGSIKIGDTDFSINGNTVRRNAMRRGSILFSTGSPLLGNKVESNRIESGSIRLSAVRNADGNIIVGNVVRGGGGISLGLASFGAYLGNNLIDGNFVSGATEGIALQAAGGRSLIRNNTSVENSRCDLSDTALSGNPQNVWSSNRFRTRCGAATE